MRGANVVKELSGSADKLITDTAGLPSHLGTCIPGSSVAGAIPNNRRIRCHKLIRKAKRPERSEELCFMIKSVEITIDID